MPRGGHRVNLVKSAKTPQAVQGAPKPNRTTSLIGSIRTPTFLQRSMTDSKMAASTPEPVPAHLSRVETTPNLQQSQPFQTNPAFQPTPSPLGSPAFEPRTMPTSKVPEVESVDELPPVVESTQQPSETLEPLELQQDKPELFVDSAQVCTTPACESHDQMTNTSSEVECAVRPTLSQTLSSESTGKDSGYDSNPDTFEDSTTDETQSTGSSVYSRDSTSIYSRDSASIYSSASSVYSSGASIYSSRASVYSFDDYGSQDLERYATRGSTELIAEETNGTGEPRLPSASQYPQRRGTAPARPGREEFQDAAARERSTLVRKAALFKNSKLPPQLPSYHTSLPQWSMVCRAAQASQDCYDSRVLHRRGTYTPANNSKDIKAMIIDSQLVDSSPLVIVSVRGTELKSLTDWAVNKAANPVKPTGFLDDEENACHAGFLQVTKAMVAQVASQLASHPASSPQPSLLFTGHSAGGAVAAMLYSHMLSTTVTSELTALASTFPSINCITFGAPPLSLQPLPKREHVPGVFLSFANEGDPVLRLSNAAYVKSLAKLMTYSPPSAATLAVAPPVKVVRRSRGTGIVRTVPVNVQVTPWEELPLWPTPAAPLTNAGEVVLMREGEKGRVGASVVTAEELSDVIFGDLAMHTCEMYLRRVKELALGAMMGRV